MKLIAQKFNINYQYPVYFIDTLFDPGKNHFQTIFDECGIELGSKFLFVIDSNVVRHNTTLIPTIDLFFRLRPYKLISNHLIIEGGEASKNDFAVTHKILEVINKSKLDRHSYIIAIGGGAVLDVVGFAATIAHRGIRHIRIPTTVLSQNDSGIGVKNGINYFGKKNFLGTFSTPFFVANDSAFLNTLSDRDYRSGISEAIKVALIKDLSFFEFIEANADNLNKRDNTTISYLIYRCAELHMQHIASGDPFEQGNSRPLDYGHWSAHKLEQLSSYEILHGEAVTMGMCLDAVYSYKINLLSKESLLRIVSLCKKLGFSVYDNLMSKLDEHYENFLLSGLQEFREHLGGRLTIMLLDKIGNGIEVNEINEPLLLESIQELKKLS